VSVVQAIPAETLATPAGRLRLAAPNKGRLVEPTLALLRDAGLVFEDHQRSLVSHVENQPIDILFVRTEDVLEFVRDGVAELGVTGTNLLTESGLDLPVLARLGYGRCRLEAAVPADSPARRLEDLDGLRLATSHPATATRFFTERGIAVEIVPLSGAVEVAPRMGLADGIVDLVSTGSTLVMNGLRSVGTLLESEAILVAGEADPERAGELTEVATMLEAVIAGRRRKYLMMNAPRASLPEIEALLPGLESPSIIPLAHEEMVAVHAVVEADEVWGLPGRLRAAGASGILVVPIEKLLP
jgi:ATP phosphoribosyltransferase